MIERIKQCAKRNLTNTQSAMACGFLRGKALCFDNNTIGNVRLICALADFQKPPRCPRGHCVRSGAYVRQKPGLWRDATVRILAT